MSRQLLSTAAPADATQADLEEVPTDWMAKIGVAGHYIALLAAWIATSGSLFFSEVLGWIPCSLCWYQRILMYPLSIIIAVGLLRRDARLHAYALPFSLGGAAVSTYHYLLQKTDWLPPPACAMGVPCTTDYINWFGFVTIPFLALTAFLIISLMMLVSRVASGAPTDDSVATEAVAVGGIGYHHVAVVAIIGTVVIGFVAAARLL